MVKSFMAKNIKNTKENFKQLAEEWFLKAKDDELSARDILNDREGAPSTVCFLSQQMAEKFLKGFLIYGGLEFLKIHDLEKLINLCEKTKISFEEIRDDARELSAFYVATRYPGDYPQFTWSQAEKAFVSAEKIKKFVLESINSFNNG